MVRPHGPRTIGRLEPRFQAVSQSSRKAQTEKENPERVEASAETPSGFLRVWGTLRAPVTAQHLKCVHVATRVAAAAVLAVYVLHQTVIVLLVYLIGDHAVFEPEPAAKTRKLARRRWRLLVDR